jgi:UDP-N-acetylmuramoyl-tripeptide--D-alanyl-D-alanine ligase
MFIALKGERTDGHNHVKQAVQKGASVCIVDHLVPEVPSNKQIVVQDTMTALESLAKFARMRSSATFFGITGSSGKTTTKEMLKACLSAQGKTHATTGNFNNQIGVPLTLAGIAPDTKYAVIEMGMNHSGELMHLSNMVRPDLTIITSIGSAHREFFPTERDVAIAKSEIFDYQNRQGTAVLNHDSIHFDFLKDAVKRQDIQHILSFGEDQTSDFRLLNIQPDNTGMSVLFKEEEREHRFHLNFFGSHFAMDALGVLALIKASGANIEQAIQTLQTLTPTAGRGAALPIQLDGKTITLIDDAYNANPSSMTASLKALGLRSGRKIAVIGDMLELGTDGPQMHADLIEPILSAQIDKVYLVGPLMKNLWNVLPTELRGMHVQKPTDLISLLKQDLQTGDNVLIKASHGTGLDVIIKELKGNK